MAYLTPVEKHVLSQFALQSKESAPDHRLRFSQLSVVSEGEVQSVANVLIGLIEKGLLQSDESNVFGLTSKGMEVMSYSLMEHAASHSL
ncbi:hypothetical protein [Dyella sp. 2HG41-7]|uniref:hypothetical protein n=1 Tax=Dyella sp. 2HG41-7 TaxID=2883239 RepID=UPI001F3EB3C7|nr:hypothetical protein [Dyella sp. 2HG41-7]